MLLYPGCQSPESAQASGPESKAPTNRRLNSATASTRDTLKARQTGLRAGGRDSTRFNYDVEVIKKFWLNRRLATRRGPAGNDDRDRLPGDDFLAGGIFQGQLVRARLQAGAGREH